MTSHKPALVLTQCLARVPREGSCNLASQLTYAWSCDMRNSSDTGYRTLHDGEPH